MILKYKNTCRVTRTIYDVTFKPGEIKDVKGYINDPGFVRVPEGKELSEIVTKSSNIAPANKSNKKPTSSKATVEKSASAAKVNAVESNKQGGRVDGTDNNK